MKYRADKSLRELLELLQAEINSIDTLMKAKTLAYTQAKGILQNITRKNMYLPIFSKKE
jgi:hypothetical protein